MTLAALNEVCLDALRFGAAELGVAAAARQFGVAPARLPQILAALEPGQAFERVLAAPFALFRPDAAAMRAAVARAPWSGRPSGYRSLLRAAHLQFVGLLAAEPEAARACLRLALGAEFEAMRMLAVTARRALIDPGQPWFVLRRGVASLLSTAAPAPPRSEDLFAAAASLAFERLHVDPERA